MTGANPPLSYSPGGILNEKYCEVADSNEGFTWATFTSSSSAHLYPIAIVVSVEGGEIISKNNRNRAENIYKFCSVMTKKEGEREEEGTVDGSLSGKVNPSDWRHFIAKMKTCVWRKKKRWNTLFSIEQLRGARGSLLSYFKCSSSTTSSPSSSPVSGECDLMMANLILPLVFLMGGSRS